MTIVAECRNCKTHDYQDKTYGNKQRVMNEMVKDGRFKGYRCTVCLNVKDAR